VEFTIIHSDDYTWLQNSYFYDPIMKFHKTHIMNVIKNIRILRISIYKFFIV